MCDFPALKELDITFHSVFWQLLNSGPVEKYQRWPTDPRLRELCLQLEGKIPLGCHTRVDCAMNCVEREMRELLTQYPEELVLVSGEGQPMVARRQGYRFFEVDVILELRVMDREILLE